MKPFGAEPPPTRRPAQAWRRDASLIGKHGRELRGQKAPKSTALISNATLRRLVTNNTRRRMYLRNPTHLPEVAAAARRHKQTLVQHVGPQNISRPSQSLTADCGSRMQGFGDGAFHRWHALAVRMGEQHIAEAFWHSAHLRDYAGSRDQVLVTPPGQPHLG